MLLGVQQEDQNFLKIGSLALVESQEIKGKVEACELG